MGDEVIHLKDPACQEISGDHARVYGREASNDVKILPADVKGIDGGLVFGRNEPLENDLPAPFHKPERPFNDLRRPCRFKNDVESQRGNSIRMP